MTTRRTRTEIIDAVAGAALDLFVERSPSAVSLREIAARADVNLGLIHRYVGSKDDVVALVLRRHTERARAAVASIDGDDEMLAVIADSVVRHPSTGRLIAGLLLDAADVTEIKGDFPLLDRLGGEGGGIDAALTYALALGWEVFGPSLLAAVGADPGDDATVEALHAAMRTIARADSAAD